MKETISKIKGDDEGLIDNLINQLQAAKKKGATHYQMTWSRDPMWSFKWFEVYRIKTKEEVKQEQIKALESKLKQLKK